MEQQAKNDVMSAEQLAETIFQQYVKSPNATAMGFGDMRDLINQYTIEIRQSERARVKELVEAASYIIRDLKDRAKWMHFEPSEDQKLLPCGNGAYVGLENALAKFQASEGV